MTGKLYHSIADNYKAVTERVQQALEMSGRKDTVRIMAVTKTIGVQRINEAIACGIDLLGENRVQEFLGRCEEYSAAQVHFIGGLQTNKVRQIVGKVAMIQSVDSEKLAIEINRCAGEVVDVLVQVNIAAEESKQGVATDRLDELLGQIAQLERVKVRGLMAIPPWGEGRKYFEKMQRLFEKYEYMDVLSMGMSGDYTEAIECGATIVRLGSVLFGSRI
jgi:hypothetical protein